jgi:hypothetical protein
MSLCETTKRLTGGIRVAFPPGMPYNTPPLAEPVSVFDPADVAQR